VEPLSLNKVRTLFLEFFEKRGHLVLPSFSLVPEDDPSVLLINAGMTPMKPWFTGAKTPPSKRVVTCQKCIRTPDIENVGKSGRHGTFFEMLGNFSFGDYFKKEAILWGWQFSVDVLKLDPERIYVSIHLDDDEAFECWRDIGFPEERIFRFDESNFWEHGVGPCGPCSEMFYDRGEEYGCGDPNCNVGCECDRYVEYWNLVFTQFDRLEDGTYVPLEKKNIDTGAGLERIASIVQNVPTLLDVDTVRAIVDKACEMTGTVYGEDESQDVAIRIITDHVRSSMMMIADGVLPGNEGRGYVLRRLIRRAARQGRLLGVDEPILAPVMRVAIAQSKDHYPELKDEERIIRVLEAEEKRFSRTIEQGLAQLREAIERGRAEGFDTLPGDICFLLHDTYGFPIELTIEIAAEDGMSVDMESFYQLMNAQRERARRDFLEKSSTAWGAISLPDHIRALEPTPFYGYDRLDSQVKLLHILKLSESERAFVEVENASEGEEVVLITDGTPFYSLGGGQTSDRGTMKQGETTIDIFTADVSGDGIVLHRGKVRAGTVYVGHDVVFHVDRVLRTSTARNHTATHLLHAALHRVLGKGADQRGSLVSPDRLRFDFVHDGPVSYEQLREVERLVNAKILENLPVVTDVMNLEDAKAQGVTALFGEKYEDSVRVVSCGDWSRELCGGTHVNSTGELLMFRIVSESGIAAGIRRIEALTGESAMVEMSKDAEVIRQLADRLRVHRDEMITRLDVLEARLKTQQEEIKRLQREKLSGSIAEHVVDEREIGPFRTLMTILPNYDAETLREAGDRFRDRLGERAVIVLASPSDDGKKVLWVAMAGVKAISDGAKSGDLARIAAKITGGGGGGRPDMAQAGGRDVSKIDDAMNAVRDHLVSIS
jgi:alanyl-tRNA synthetase